MRFGMLSRTGPGIRQVVGFEDWSTGKVIFGAPHCNQWGVCGIAVRKCMNRRNFGLGRCMVTTRPVPKLLWTLLLLLLLRGREVETGIVVSVSLCVNLSCLSARISRKPHGQTKLIFFCGITNFLVF